MRKTSLFIVVLVCVSILGMTVVSCDNTTGGDTDTWTNVTSLNQLNGTWKGSYSESKTLKEFMEEEGEEWNSSMEALVGDIRVTVKVDITATINSSARTQAISTTMTQTFSGGNIDAVWLMIKSEFPSELGFTPNDTNHSITMTFDNPPSEISEDAIAEMLNSGLQINQHRTKIKMPAGTMGEGSPALILTKQ